MNLDKLKIKGTVILKRFDKDSNLLEEVTINNMVVDGGLDYFAKKSVELTDSVIDKVGISTGTTAVTASDTQLSNTANAEYADVKFKVRTQLAEVLLDGVFIENQYVDKSVTEIGLFTDANELVARTVVPSDSRFVKAASDFLSVTWKLQFG